MTRWWAGLALLGLAAAAPAGGAYDAARPQVVTWLRQHAFEIRIDEPATGPDVAALAAMCGASRIVAMGESTHGTHEMLAVRNRIIEYLIEKERVGTVAFETGFREAEAIDDFLGSHDNRDPPDEIVRAMMSWSDDGTGPGRTENHELLRWLHAWNLAHRDRRIRLYGFDLSGRAARGGLPNAAAPLRAALDYARRLEPRTAAALEERVVSLLPEFQTQSYSDKAYDRLGAPQRDTITAVIAELAGLFSDRRSAWTKATGSEAYARAAHAVSESAQLDHYLRINSGQAEMSDAAWRTRDSVMARNVEWIAGRLGNGERLFFFAHNKHVGEASENAMGSFLAAHGVPVFTIGTVDLERERAGARAPTPPLGPDGLASVCAEVALPAFVVDLSKLPAHGPVHDWWMEPHPVNPVSLARKDLDQVRAAAWFDALIFVRTLHYVS